MFGVIFICSFSFLESENYILGNKLVIISSTIDFIKIKWEKSRQVRGARQLNISAGLKPSVSFSFLLKILGDCAFWKVFTLVKHQRSLRKTIEHITIWRTLISCLWILLSRRLEPKKFTFKSTKKPRLKEMSERLSILLGISQKFLWTIW